MNRSDKNVLFAIWTTNSMGEIRSFDQALQEVKWKTTSANADQTIFGMTEGLQQANCFAAVLPQKLRRIGCL
jgi:hypothetical protein